jgi:hypothetical protein
LARTSSSRTVDAIEKKITEKIPADMMMKAVTREKLEVCVRLAGIDSNR